MATTLTRSFEHRTPMKSFATPCAVLLSCFASASVWAVDNPSLTFRGSEHQPIPLNPAQPVEITADGNIEATCVFQATNPQRCVNVGTQVSGNVPQASFTANVPFVEGSTTVYAVTSGQQFVITRSVTGTADFCLPSTVAGAGVGVQGWSTVSNVNGTNNVSISASIPAGETRDVTLGLRCYNSFGAPEQAFTRTFRVSPTAGPNPGACTLPPDPLIRPAGFTEYVRTWQQVFNGFSFPTTPSFRMPVGAFTVNLSVPESPPSAGMYISIPISMPANSTLTWRTYPATGNVDVGYNASRQGTMFISLSPCSGDLRPLDPSAADVFQRCARGALFEGPISFNTRTTASCNFPPGDYWLNIIHADPSVPNFGPTSNTCSVSPPSPTASCETNVTVSFSQS